MRIRAPGQFYIISILALFSLVFAPTNVFGASASLVSQHLLEKAERQGTVRVIIRLGSVSRPETWVESDIELANRRQYIAFARLSTRSSLSTVAHQVIREYRDFPYMALRVAVDGLQVLDSLPGIVTEILEDELNIPSLAESVPLVQGNQAWAGGFGGTSLDGAGTVIAVIDSGVDKTHPFLSGKVIEEACFSSNDDDPDLLATSVCPGAIETSFADGSGAPCDADGCDHGTHVAGIAAGNGQNGVVAGTSGVAKGAAIMAVQVFSKFSGVICSLLELPAPCALTFTSDIMAGLEHVYNLRSEHNFAVVNLSLGGQTFSRHCDTDPLKAFIDALRAANIAAVIASGNDAATNAISSPACISSAVSVGSTADGSGGTTTDSVSDFSNSAKFLTLLAPGDLITSSVPGSGFASFRGTSMAAPHVAGAFAILKQAAPSVTVSQMIAALQTSGVPVFNPANSITKPRIRILDALNQLPSVQFDAASYSVAENRRRVRITVTRFGVATDSLRVDYTTSDGSATAGSDYIAKSGTLIFSPRRRAKTFTIRITNDTTLEATEIIKLTLSNPVGGLLGPQNTAVLSVTDNDPATVIRLNSANTAKRHAHRLTQ